MTADWDDEPDALDDDYPEEQDETETVVCANCGEQVYEDAPNCPYCGEYLIAKSRRFSDGKPLWYVVLALLGIIATIY